MDDHADEGTTEGPPGPEGAPTPVDRVLDHWDEVIADMEATAEEYRRDGWDVVEVHPGDVATATESEAHDRWGIDVLVPDNEFPEVERRVDEENGSFGASEVFRAQAGGMVFLVVAMLDERDHQAIVFPAYYDIEQSADVLDRARQEGEVRTHLRTLSEDAVVTFTHEDPSMFLPE